jgi:hypothetical protein
MIEFIIKNKEWLFSGIGVFLIAGAFAILKLFLRRRQKASSMQSLSLSEGSHGGDLNAMLTANVIGAERITPDAIQTAFCSAPLLQRSEIARQYQGLRVQWKGNVFSVEMLAWGKAKIEIKWQNSAFGIFFVLGSTKYKGLGILKRGDVLTVDGKIEQVSEFYISLTDAKLVSGPGGRSSNI